MKEKKRISILEPGTLTLGILLSILSAVICMQIMGQFGIAPNTSLISAVLVMIVARIPMTITQKFRNLERQNYTLSFASSAGFAAANCGFVSIAVVFIMGRTDLMIPMAFGSLIGSMISIFITGKIFDSKIFPAKGPYWPLGTAIASSLDAGDEGGKKGIQLLQGLIVGAIASFFGIPAAGVGIVFIANVVAMAALGLGIVLRGYSTLFFNGFDIGRSNIPQGMMIGAGIIAFIQIFLVILKRVPVRRKKAASDLDLQSNKKTDPDTEAEYTISDSAAKKTMISSGLLFIIGAVITALVMGVFSEMSPGQSILWVIFAGIASLVVMILVGTVSMRSGWAPTFAVVTVCITIGVLMGFPPLPMAVLAGYLGSIGPCLADTGIGLKSGWIIRGSGTDRAVELYGRKQQVLIKQLGAVIGIAVAVIFGTMLIHSDIVPPMSIFYADTVTSATDSTLLLELALWAIPGAVLQAAFGNKSVGLMLATGMLINNPVFGISVLAAVGFRLVIGTKHMTVRAPGLIAGDGLFGFAANVFRMFF